MTVGFGRERKTLLRVFSSRTGQWGTAVTLTAQLPDNLVLDLSSPAVVHRGAVHWIYGAAHASGGLAVRPGTAEASVSRFDLPPPADMHSRSDLRLSSSDQGCLSLVLLDRTVISIWNFQDDGKSWVLHKTIVSEHPSAHLWLSIEALCHGSLFLSVSGGGLDVLNLETEMMTKVGTGLIFYSYSYMRPSLYPYVPDLSSCLRAMKNL